LSSNDRKQVVLGRQIAAEPVVRRFGQNLMSLAIGGVRVLVPESYLPRAREIALAIERGDFALDGATEEKRP
jgi:hypothetical protein